MWIVQTTRHLADLEMIVEYYELPNEDGSFPNHWASDPGAGAFAPQATYFRNGTLVGEEREKPGRVSKTPFKEEKFPRRGGGFTRVYPGEDDYEILCKEQGLSFLLDEEASSSPVEHAGSINGVKGENGDSVMLGQEGYEATPAIVSGELPNGHAQ
jgi:hypothetical protein